ncbi:MAG: DegQ family serine endoprotease [Candidatus Neomarinimicrobiota bacterium]|nr:DegQ family serine endoprotease [Candidatus Neomarinimicrobiota bacterium]
MRKNIIIIFSIILSIGFSQKSIVQQFSKTFADVAEKVNPAVVTISTDKVIKMDRFNQYPFNQFFGWDRNPEQQQEYRTRALGSGVIVDASKGYIITNNHVVEDMDKISVKLMDKRIFEATIVGSDPKSDLAVLQIEADDLIQVDIGNSDKLRVGEWVIAIGSPFTDNLSHTVTAGIISAMGRSDIISRENYEDFIQIDAAINPGNSGGALVDLNGQLIGINTAIATGGYERSNRGVGFAIPTNMVYKVMNDLIDKGYVVRGWLGVAIQEIDDSYAKALGLDTRDGALISNVANSSPADNAGLITGDVILEFNDVSINNSSHLKNVVSSSEPGKRYKVDIIRDGRRKSIYVKLGELPNEPQMAFMPNDKSSTLGITVQDLNSSLRKHYNLSQDDDGVVVTEMDNDSEAYRSGIREGDIIIRVGTNNVRNSNDFKDLIRTSSRKNTVLLLVKRNDVSRFYALEIDN